MPAIGSVNVKVGATTGGLVTGLGNAARAVTGFGSRVTSVAGKGLGGLATGAGKAAGGIAGMGSSVLGLASKLGPLGVAITGVAGAAGIGLLVNNSLQTLDANAKLSKSLGLTQAQLTGYQHAAELSGVSSEALQGALGKLTRKGISLEVLADKMALIENPTERAKLAFDVLGKSGQELIPLLSEGGAAIRAMAQEGAELGGVFTPEEIAAVEEANDAVSKTQAAFVGVANVIAVTVAPALQMVADKATSVGKWMKNAFTEIVPIVVQAGVIINSVWESVATVAGDVFSFLSGGASVTFSNVKDFILDALILGEFVFQNFGSIAALVWEKIKLGAVQAFGVIGHFFTGVMPAWLSWFSTNWQDVMFSAFDLASTVFINIGTNIRTIFSSLWKWIKSGFAGSFEIDWVPLTKGAVNAIKKLPDIPARAISELERNLGQNVATMGDSLGTKLGDHMVKRREELLTKTSPAEITDKVKTSIDIPALDDNALVLKKLSEPVGPTAIQRGSSEAFGAIFKAMRGNPGDDVKRTAEAQLRQATATAKGIDKLVKAPKIELVAGDV